MLYSETTALRKIARLNKKIRAVCGGTSASKTISILLYLIAKAQTDTSRTLTSVVSESIPHLKRGAMRDFKNIMQGHNYWKDDRWNITDSIYTFETGSQIEFFSSDNGPKLKGGRRDRCFMNEANEQTFDAFNQLEVRTKEFMILDWNPTHEFFFYTDILGTRDDVDFITLTYLDNEALSEEIKKSIEARKGNKQWWQVYGLGLLGEVEGRIYTGWQMIDSIPHEARLERRGLDFGYSCLKGDTIVPTITGDKRIDEIIEGEYVLTRKGYKKVIWSGSRGVKKVYSVDFGLDKRIIVTGDHRVFTADGWKEVKDLSNKETICELKWSLMEKFIDVILKGNIRTISILKKKLVERLSKIFYTGIFTNKFTGKYQKDIVSTTSTKTHSITVQKTLLQCLIANTTKYIFQIILGKLKKQKCKKLETGCVSQKTIGWSDEKNRLLQPEIVLKNVQNVVRKLLQQTPTRSFAEQYAEKKPTQEIAKKNILASFVVRFLRRLHISKETPVLSSVQISSRLLNVKVEVFDLTVEDEHEFFANGVLVHNCDPTVVIDIYRYNGGFILDEILYQKGLSNKSIADFLNARHGNILTLCDSAEPKSIDELKSYGINAIPCIKGPGSVNQGIQFVQDQRISLTESSLKTKKAYNNYMWAKDRDGNILNVPDDTIHEWSNPMDAIRYGLDSYKERTPIFQGLGQKSTFR